MAEHPLQFSVTKMRLGPENSLISTTVDADDHVAQAMIEHESFSASLHSLFAVDILTRVGERYGNISAAAHWFESPLIDAPTASRVCRAIELYELGDYDSSASLLAPRLERIVRGIARSVGLTVTRSPDRQGRPGGVKTLGSLLQPLRHVLPESTWRYLKVLLVESNGLNLRNRIAHGLDDEIGQREAALLVHAVCHLSILHPAADEPTTPSA